MIEGADKNAPLHPPTFQKLPEVGYGFAEIGMTLNFNGRPYLLPKKEVKYIVSIISIEYLG